MNKTCKYCHQPLNNHSMTTKFGIFCCEEHLNEYLKNLSNEEYIQLQHSFCVCSDED